MARAYFVTALCFLVLILLYRILPTKKFMLEFQHKPFLKHSRSHYVNIWYVLSAVIFFNCMVMFWQSGGVLPLFQGATMDPTSYSIYRAEISNTINMSLANLTLQLLVTTSIFISFVCICKSALLYRSGSVLLLAFSACFSLARSFLPIALLILLFMYLLYKPISLNKVPRWMILSILIILLLVLSLIVYSTKENSIRVAMHILSDRLIHGQWLGMPLYLYYYENYHITSMTFLHPIVRSVLGINVPSTPGRELMEYFFPLGVSAGSVGNIPTFFAGEAYAVAGWWGVCLSVLYISLMLCLLTFVFKQMRKTYISCCLYGWLAYKVTSGLTLGISAFLFSGFSAMIGFLLVWNALHSKYFRA